MDHKLRRIRKVSTVSGLAVLLAIAFFSADAKAAKEPWLKPTVVFDGKEFTAKPATFSGWTMVGTEGVRQNPLLTGIAGQPSKPGTIKWKFWRRNLAVGVGTAWTPDCLAPCEAAYPWNGSRKRITLYGRKGHKFTKARIFHWTAWGRPVQNNSNYWLKLAFPGHNANYPWHVTEIHDGLPQR